MKRFIKEEEDMGKYTTSRYFIKRRLETSKDKQQPTAEKGPIQPFEREVLSDVTTNDAKGIKRAVRAAAANIHRNLTQLGKEVGKTRRKMVAETDYLNKSDRPRALSEPPKDPFKEIVIGNIVQLDREINFNKRIVDTKMKLCSASNYLKIINFNS